ncbi:MAG: hypothetical protein V4734_11040, partial [Terriglobus sp.]
LTYVCDMTLKGRDVELNEQRIGHAVFGRSPDYDSSIDGIVRTQASRLRQRLDLYFEQEGVGEPVRIVIPKGGYVPQFLPRMIPAEPKPELVPSIPSVVPKATPASPPRKWNWFPWALCLVLLVAVVAQLVRSHNRSVTTTSNPIASHPLWGRIFVPGQATLEVPADSGLVLSHAFDQQNVPLTAYLAGKYRTDKIAGASSMSPEMRALRNNFADRRYTSIVDLEAAVRLAQIAQTAHSTLQVRYARDVRPNDLKTGNVILMGAAEANPWVELFEQNMNFLLQDDFKAGAFLVINKAPHPGEQKQWASRVSDPQHNVYGVVAFTPNLSGDGDVLIVEGTSMAGTEAAWDFISDDSELKPFLKRIQQSDDRLPHFEVLVGTQNMSSSAVHSNVLAWRTSD